MEHEFNKLGININLYEFLFGYSKSCSPTQTNILPDSESPNIKENIAKLPKEMSDIILKFVYKYTGHPTTGIDKWELTKKETEELVETLDYICEKDNDRILKQCIRDIQSSDEGVRDRAFARLDDYSYEMKGFIMNARNILESRAKVRDFHCKMGKGEDWMKYENKVLASEVDKQYCEKKEKIDSAILDLVTRDRTVVLSDDERVEMIEKFKQIPDIDKILRSRTLFRLHDFYREKELEIKENTARADRAVEKYKAFENANKE